MIQPSMRQHTTLRSRNNPLYVDLFERSSQSPASFESSLTMDLVKMAEHDGENARKRLSEYIRPIIQRLVTHIHAPLNRGSNFRIDSQVMSMLPVFHGKPFVDPYRHVDELNQVYEIN